MVKVSVIVPIFNAEKYLAQCIDSIVAQTLSDIEIILIDDGSTDGSAEICRKYLDDERVSYFFKENEGLAAARQDGIDRATGEYIGFVDSDDWIEPEMYGKMYDAAKSNDSDVVFCNCIQNEDGYRFKPEMRSGAYNREQILRDVLPRSLAYINEKGEKRTVRWSNCLRIFKRQLLTDRHISFDRRFRRSQDSQLTYEAMLVAQNFYYLGEEYLYHNRVVGDSLSRGYTKNMWPLYVPLIERLYADTEAFQEADLVPQMHLRAFYFVLECIENEMKPSFPYDQKKRIELINDIVSHPLCERYYGNVPIENMAEPYQVYYDMIHRRDVKGIVRYEKKLKSQKKRRSGLWSPIAHFITEGPVVGVIYKKLRHKEK